MAHEDFPEKNRPIDFITVIVNYSIYKILE